MMAAPVDVPNAALVAVIANPPEGEVCFLCASTNGNECVWDEVGQDIIGSGRAAGVHYEDRVRMHQTPMNMAEFHKVCRFACYRRYIFTVSSWSSGLGRIRIPTCVEESIRDAFPGNGVFVGFQDNRNAN